MEVPGQVQPQAGIVGILLPVLQLHLHQHPPPALPQDVGALPGGQGVTGGSWDPRDIMRTLGGYQGYLEPTMSVVALSTRLVTHSSSSPQSLKNGIWKEPGVILVFRGDPSVWKHPSQYTPVCGWWWEMPHPAPTSQIHPGPR